MKDLPDDVKDLPDDVKDLPDDVKSIGFYNTSRASMERISQTT